MAKAGRRARSGAGTGVVDLNAPEPAAPEPWVSTVVFRVLEHLTSGVEVIEKAGVAKVWTVEARRVLSRGRWRPVAQMLQAIKADARAAGERLEAGAGRLERVQVVGRDAASIELYNAAWQLDAPLVMKVLTDADGIVCPRTIAGKYLTIVEPDNGSLAAIHRVVAALEPVRDLRLLTKDGPWGRGSDHSHGARPIYRVWRDGEMINSRVPGMSGCFRVPGHHIGEVFAALSCWADGARTGRFAAAELKVDVMAKELRGFEMVVPYYKAAHWTRGWADREKAARFVEAVTAFGREEAAVTREWQAAARSVGWG